MSLLPILIEQKIVAIVRGISAGAADRTAEALASGGIRLIEVTMNTRGALEILSRWRERYSDRLRIGAGTVLDLDMARDAVAAGAEFLIAPNLDESVVAYGRDAGLDVWPGAATPTEIVRAWKAGASAVKVFPMGALGPRYLREVRGPLDSIPLIAVGGVGLDNLREFLDAGAVGVGVSSNLASPDLVEAERFDAIEERARQFVRAAFSPHSPAQPKPNPPTPFPKTKGRGSHPPAPPSSRAEGEP